MLSVLQVTPELNAGGVERTTLEIAQAISRAGGLALVASAGGRLEPDLEAAGGALIRLPLQSKSPFTIIANAFRLAREVRRRRINLVHARSRAPAWSALLAARLAGVPFVTTFHGIYNFKSPLKRFYNSVMARGDVVIANSHYTREHVLRNYDVAPERVVAIPRGADLERFDPRRVAPEAVAAMRMAWRLAPDDARCVIIAPARLTRWKGQLVLIEAARLLNNLRPGSFKVVLAGDPQGRRAYVEALERAITAAGLQESVLIAGHIDDMPAALLAADIAVFPVTEAEAFGRGAVEAQAMGLPVIASGIGGYTETVIEGETGVLVAPRGAPALAAAIEAMIDLGTEGRKAMGRRAAAHARATYATATLQASTLAIYQRLIGEAKLRKSVDRRSETVP